MIRLIFMFAVVFLFNYVADKFWPIRTEKSPDEMKRDSDRQSPSSFD